MQIPVQQRFMPWIDANSVAPAPECAPDPARIGQARRQRRPTAQLHIKLLRSILSRSIAIACFIACCSCNHDADSSNQPAPSATTTGTAARPAGGNDPGDSTRKPSTPPEPLRSELAPYFNLIRAGELGAARVRLRKHLNLHPDDGQATFLFGLTYHEERLYEKARPHLERAVALAPNFDPPHYFLGWCLYYLGELDAANESFRAHVNLRPAAADTHFGLGLIALDQDRLDDAADQLNQALALFQNEGANPPDVAKTLARLGDLAQRLGDLEEARDRYAATVAIFPDAYEIHYKLSQVLLRLGEDEAAAKAEEAYRAARDRVRPDLAGRAP